MSAANKPAQSAAWYRHAEVANRLCGIEDAVKWALVEAAADVDQATAAMLENIPAHADAGGREYADAGKPEYQHLWDAISEAEERLQDRAATYLAAVQNSAGHSFVDPETDFNCAGAQVIDLARAGARDN